MNDLIYDRVAFDRYIRDIQRAEANLIRQAAIGSPSASPRTRLATVLVSLATRLQPEIAVPVQRPVQTATA